MNVLGIDTATFVTAVGVRRDGRLHAELHAEGRGGHAASLPGLVEQGLREAGLRAADLDGIAVSEGPGSFTGLRVGVSFAKAVAYATGARLVGVPTLPAIARALETPSDVVGVCLDARRGEVYLGIYGSCGRHTFQEPMASSPAAAVGRLRELGARIVVGDAAVRYAEAFACFRGRLVPLGESPPKGGIIALDGEERLHRTASTAVADLVPRYLRAPEAESRREASLTREKTL